MEVAQDFIETFSFALIGIFAGCKIFAYHISPVRKVGAAACGAFLGILMIPVPLIGPFIPVIGLYVCLMDDSYDRVTVNKVFIFALAFVFLSTFTLGILMT